MNTNANRRAPAWFTAVCIAAALPVLAFPTLLGMASGEHSLIIKLWPVYAIASSWLAWASYPQRPALSWILIILTLLSHASVTILTR